ncbi:MAG: hypothetical protein ACFBSG_13400 [Leptolyngbyaceae cyanobacterium]
MRRGWAWLTGTGLARVSVHPDRSERSSARPLRLGSEEKGDRNTGSLVDQANYDRALEQEIRQGRQFSLAEAIAQQGGDFLKGESTIPRLTQVKNELMVFIRTHLNDPSGALLATLLDLVRMEDAACSRHLDSPLGALVELLQPLVTQESHLREFVWRVDMRWGRMYGERPHFKYSGQPPHPDAEYTLESVRSHLQGLITAVRAEASSSSLHGH